jgi:protein-tyrosine phosphatase
MVAVLMVCTGNICRSPSAEAVLRHHVAAAGLADRITVDSAGTQDYHRGEPPSRLAVDCAEARGYDLSPLRARQVQSEDLLRFDLILAMDRGHLGRLAGMGPDGRSGKIRLFMDFAPDDIRADAAGEVPDPYDGDRQDYEHSLDLIESAIPGLIATLRRDYL